MSPFLTELSILQRGQTRPLQLVCLLYLVVAIAQQELGGLAAEQIKSLPWPNTGVGN